MNFLNGLKQNNSLKLVLIAIAYIVLNQVALLFAFPETKSIGVWFPSGLALGMMILYGMRIWPAITIGGLISSMMLFLHYQIPFNAESIGAMTVMAGVDTGEALFAAFLIKKFIKNDNPFKQTSHVFLFILIATISSFLSGVLVALGFTASNIIEEGMLFIHTFTHGIANLVSIFIFTPLLVSWAGKFRLNISKEILIEGALFVSALGLVMSLLYIESIATTVEKSFPFLIMPFVFWMAFRGSKQIITLSIFVLSLIALFLTSQLTGPFVLETESESILILQIFLSIMSITALIINATVHERAHAEKALKKFNEKLETSVKERTKELKEEINTRRATEEKIKISNKKLRKANSELDNFVYSVSHDLRAPIASVLGLVNIAKKEKSVKNMKKYLNMVAKSAEQQDAFIRDILDLSRNSRLDIAREEVNFEEIINNIFDQYQYIDQRVKVSKYIAVEQEYPFYSDKSRIKVILNNLISNAIRHCEHDKVNIHVEVNVNETMATVKIQDDGQGIGKEHLEHIFKMFYRGTDSTAGSGLGLYIVNETIDKLRGAISIDSEENEGTTVKIELPNLSGKKALV